MSKIQDILNEMVNILINQRGKTFNFDVSFFSVYIYWNIKFETDIGKIKTNRTIVIYGDDIKRS